MKSIRTARIRYSKPASVIGGVVGSVMACAGLTGIVAIFGFFPQAWPIGLFLCLWTLVTASIAAFHWANVFSRAGFAVEEIDVALDTASTPRAEDRLQTLEKLKERKLISDEEYAQKRQDVLRSV